MSQLLEPLWRLVASQYAGITAPNLNRHIAAALASPIVQSHQALLAPLGLRLDPTPLLWKKLPGPHLRLFFPVQGATAAVEEGMIVALVLLHDVDAGRTLYAHMVHAGPEANPLLKHLYGPMANPKAQMGPNGDRATLRLLEHKRVIWACFLQDRERLGPDDAGRRWRDRYLWSLVRLYFCERCSGCRWGTPRFDGPAGEPYRAATASPGPPARIEPGIHGDLLEALRGSEAWRVESAYARRGGFEVQPKPRLAARLGNGFALVGFAMDTEFLEAGSLVALVAYVNEASRQVLYAQTLSAGPEPEALFLFGDRALGLPPPRPDATAGPARDAYIRWRREAWVRFWLDELEEGLHAASRNWLDGFWLALAKLFGTTKGD